MFHANRIGYGVRSRVPNKGHNLCREPIEFYPCQATVVERLPAGAGRAKLRLHHDFVITHNLAHRFRDIAGHNKVKHRRQKLGVNHAPSRPHTFDHAQEIALKRNIFSAREVKGVQLKGCFVRRRLVTECGLHMRDGMAHTCLGYS